MSSPTSLPSTDTSAGSAATDPRTRTILLARDVRKRFGANEVLRGVSLQVQRGEVICVIGPSGSGKTTFCAVSTTWSGSIVDASSSMASFSGIGSDQMANWSSNLLETSRASARRSASSSSASTCGRI